MFAPESPIWIIVYAGWLIFHVVCGFAIWWWLFNPDTFARLSAWYKKDIERGGSKLTRRQRYKFARWGDASYGRDRFKGWVGKWLITILMIAVMAVETSLFNRLFRMFSG